MKRSSNRKPRVVALGTFDKNKPRSRILLRGLRENGVEVIECHQEVWGNVEDKSQIAGLGNKLAILGRWAAAYPRLIWRYARLPRHDAVLVNYLGLFDVLILWPFIRIRGVRMIWDVFISLYNTIVEDRNLIARHNPLAWTLWGLEWLALRIVDVAIIDTEAHAAYLRSTFSRSTRQVRSVFVGAESERFRIPTSLSRPPIDGRMQVLFYGQFIPLHGIDTVVKAAKLSENEPIDWLLIGKGQEEARIRSLLDDLGPKYLKWVPWVKYEQLIGYLASSHVGLGIFGNSDKASRVIPNKVYQILSANVPLITRDSPAVRELIDPQDPYRLLITPSDPKALVAAVLRLQTLLKEKGWPPDPNPYVDRITPQYCGKQLLDIIEDCDGK